MMPATAYFRSCDQTLAAVFERASHRIDHAARKEIDRGFAAELIAGAAFNQARSEATLHRRHDMRAAGLGPDQP